jgi:hypothetical protein
LSYLRPLQRGHDRADWQEVSNNGSDADAEVKLARRSFLALAMTPLVVLLSWRDLPHWSIGHQRSDDE